MVLWALLLLLAALSTVRAGAYAPRLPRRFDNQQIALRWDCIEGSPFWVGGRAPSFDFRLGRRSLHVISLEPRQHTTVLLAENTLLRVYSPDHELDKNDLELHLSNGSGLQVPGELISSPDACSLFVYPQSLAPSLVTLTRPEARATSIRVALFVARLDFESELFRHHEPVSLAPAAVPVDLSKGLLAPGVKSWYLRAKRPVSLTVEGPARYAFTTCLYSRYRNVLPARKNDPSPQRVARFAARQLSPPESGAEFRQSRVPPLSMARERYACPSSDSYLRASLCPSSCS